MSETQSSYRQIMKATSIFGGVQVFQIIISIVRSKFIAVLLGPMGMGISGLLTGAVGLIAAFSNFGLSTSAVKDISAAYSSKNDIRLSIVVKIFRRWVWVTGFLGMTLTFILAPWLSDITFGSREYTFAFRWISIILLLNQISAGQGVLLRGMRQIRYMAQSAMLGSIIGLFTTIPLYYLYGIEGIVPAIIIAAVTSLLITWYYARRLEIKPIYVSKARTIAEGKGMLRMGFMISLSSMVMLASAYIVRIYISNTGGVDQVGLYNAGFAIITTYVGMIFTAMSTDYYPRLSAVAFDNVKVKEVINQQAEIAILILAPVIVIFLTFINWLIIILYSTKFIPINDMILYAALGMFFKAASWAMSFVFLAKGETKTFFWNELITNIYLLCFNIIGYKYFGLMGLGISFLTAYILYAIQVYVILRRKYLFCFSKEFFKIFFFQFALAVACLSTTKIAEKPYTFIIGSFFIIASVYLSYKELDKRLNIKAIFTEIKNKFR